jgi:hypothetical protein
MEIDTPLSLNIQSVLCIYRIEWCTETVDNELLPPVPYTTLITFGSTNKLSISLGTTRKTRSALFCWWLQSKTYILQWTLRKCGALHRDPCIPVADTRPKAVLPLDTIFTRIKRLMGKHSPELEPSSRLTPPGFVSDFADFLGCHSTSI